MTIKTKDIEITVTMTELDYLSNVRPESLSALFLLLNQAEVRHGR